MGKKPTKNLYYATPKQSVKSLESGIPKRVVKHVKTTT